MNHWNTINCHVPVTNHKADWLYQCVSAKTIIKMKSLGYKLIGCCVGPKDSEIGWLSLAVIPCWKISHCYMRASMFLYWQIKSWMYIQGCFLHVKHLCLCLSSARNSQACSQDLYNTATLAPAGWWRKAFFLYYWIFKSSCLFWYTYILIFHYSRVNVLRMPRSHTLLDDFFLTG